MKRELLDHPHQLSPTLLLLLSNKNGFGIKYPIIFDMSLKKKVNQTHTHTHTHTHHRLIGLVGGVFANDPGDLGSIPGRVKPKTLKMGLDAALLNIQQYKVSIKGKVEQSRERSSTLPYISV